MQDILFKTEEYTFSYRVAGICIQNEKILLQKAPNAEEYAFPGGHVTFGETNETTLAREFKEEIGEDVTVKDLKWVGQIFFPWEGKPWHQICLFYEVQLINPSIPLTGSFVGSECMDHRTFDLTFCWVDLHQLSNIILYPPVAVDLINKWDEGIQAFTYHE